MDVYWRDQKKRAHVLCGDTKMQFFFFRKCVTCSYHCALKRRWRVPSVQTGTWIFVNETNWIALLINFSRTHCYAGCYIVPVTFHLVGVMKDRTIQRHIAIEKWEGIVVPRISIIQPLQINIRCAADVGNERQKSVCSSLLQKSSSGECLIMFTFLMFETSWICKNDLKILELSL